MPPPLDRKDGSFLVRYRLYGTVLGGLKVEVLHQSVAVAKSPYTIDGLWTFLTPQVIYSVLDHLDILNCTFNSLVHPNLIQTYKDTRRGPYKTNVHDLMTGVV